MIAFHHSKKQKLMSDCTKLALFIYTVWDPNVRKQHQVEWMDLPTSINLANIILHSLSQS